MKNDCNYLLSEQIEKARNEKKNKLRSSQRGANHGAIHYGHIGPDLITLAAMLRIPVDMHNVDECSLFRRSSWSAFGTDSFESADYIACKNFGPIYG